MNHTRKIPMNSIADRYNRLASAYINLSDKFHQLDVAHMTLKQKILPAIKAIKDYQTITNQLNRDNARLEQTIETLTTQQQRLEQDQAIQKETETELVAKVNTLTHENATLQAALQEIKTKYEALAELEPLIQSDPQDLLLEAEQQMELVEETLREIALDSDPDLNKDDQHLLEVYLNEGDNLVNSEATSNDSTSLNLFERLLSIAQ